MSVDDTKPPCAGSGVVALLDSLALIRQLIALTGARGDATSPQQVVDMLVEHQDIDGAVLRWYQRAAGGDEHVGLVEREVVSLRTPDLGPDSDLHDMLEVLADSALRVDKVRHEPDLSRRALNWRGSLLVVPIVVTEKLFGFLAVWNRAPYYFVQWHMSLLESCTNLLKLGAGMHPQLFAEWVAQASPVLPGEVDPPPQRFASGSMPVDPAMSHDVKPMLYSRDGFIDEVKWQFEHAKDTSAPMFLFHVDIDRFRVIRECGGHRTAERVVWVIADLLRTIGNDQLLLGRLGSDEFGIFVRSADVTEAVELARALIDRVDRLRLRYAGQRYDVSISIGISQMDAAQADLRTILRNALMACRNAQHQGGGVVQVYSDFIHERCSMLQEGRVLNAITRAMKEDRFALFAQAIVPTCDAGLARQGRPESYEILLRILDRHGEPIEAHQFVPIAERYSLSAKIDRWVVRETFRCLAQQTAASSSSGDLYALNLSGHSVDDHTFLDFVISEFARSGLPPERICFEITETAAISDMDGARTLIHVLKDIGCKFALDDFGSGHCSFLYLRDLPVDYLKIDGALVREVVRDPISASFVRSIEDIGRLLGKHTVAEHVESRAILDTVKDIGVDFVQGFHVGVPKPLAIVLRQDVAANCEPDG